MREVRAAQRAALDLTESHQHRLPHLVRGRGRGRGRGRVRVRVRVRRRRRRRLRLRLRVRRRLRLRLRLGLGVRVRAWASHTSHAETICACVLSVRSARLQFMPG